VYQNDKFEEAWLLPSKKSEHVLCMSGSGRSEILRQSFSKVATQSVMASSLRFSASPLPSDLPVQSKNCGRRAHVCSTKKGNMYIPCAAPSSLLPLRQKRVLPPTMCYGLCGTSSTSRSAWLYQHKITVCVCEVKVQSRPSDAASKSQSASCMAEK
jgi:hypothetical protein